MVAEFTTLVPFVGLHGPGFHLITGDYLHLVNWSKTPGDTGPYRCVWHIGTDDVRTMYIDPEAAAPVVCAFHDFQRVVGADIRFEWPDPLHLTVRMKAGDGTSLEMDLRLVKTAGTRLLEWLSSTMPRDRYPPAGAQRLGDALVKRLLTRGGRSVGLTETGRTFNFTQADHLLVVRDASINWNGEARELALRPTRQLYFGDEPVAARPYVFVGTAMLERGPELDATG